MLDGVAQGAIRPWLDLIGRFLAARGVSANSVTVAGCGIGLTAALLIAVQHPWVGLVLLLLSRLLDGLDGAVARITGITDFGGFLDIVLDFVFYGAIPLGFIFADPGANALAGATLIFSFYVNGASFLAYSAQAAKRDMVSHERGVKSIFFTTGLAEATETLAVFVAMCLFAQSFSVLAWCFAGICFYTALARIVQAARTFD